MSKLPIMKPRKLIKVLIKLGFEEVRQKGSHKFFYHQQNSRATVIPMHTKDIGKGLMRKIISEIGLTPDEFLKHFKK